jgi:hypothetical protein
MATVLTAGALATGTANLCTAQTGNGATTNVALRSPSQRAALLRVTTTIGATPTCTYLIEGSADGTNFFPVVFADSATPTTFGFATFAITTATTVLKLLQVDQPWVFLRVTFSANTNVTNTVDLWTF